MVQELKMLAKYEKVTKLKIILLVLCTIFICIDCNNGKAIDDPDVTENVETTWYNDLDGDGFGYPGHSIQAVDQPTGYVSNNTDPDDTESSIYPGSPEICNDGKDNDQDGTTDCNDDDCSSESSCLSEPQDIVVIWGDFGITDSTYDGEADWDQIVENKFGNDYRVLDWVDLLAYYQRGESLTDFLNGLGLTEFGDGGFVYRSGLKIYSSDKFYFISHHDHNKPDNYLAHANIDNYLISLGSLDTTQKILAIKNSADVSVEPKITWYKDTDGDGYSDGTIQVSDVQPGNDYYEASELTAVSGDDNDNDSTIFPGAIETCGDGKDNNQDGNIDEDCPVTETKTWYKDSDGDGYSDGTSQISTSRPSSTYYEASELHSAAGDCDDTDDSINPGATEIADDKIDQDCTGYDLTTWYKDTDGDSYSDGSSQIAEVQPSSYYESYELNATSGDCDDNNFSINPGEAEIADDGIDQDCSGKDLKTWYKDEDGDGYSDGSTQLAASKPNSNYYAESELIASSGDCVDINSSINPGAAEICGDEIDNNCDEKIDENCESVITVFENDHIYLTNITLDKCELKEVGSFVVPSDERWTRIKFVASQGDLILLVDDDEMPSIEGDAPYNCEGGYAKKFYADQVYDWYNGTAIFDWTKELEPGVVLRMAVFSYDGVLNHSINAEITVEIQP